MAEEIKRLWTVKDVAAFVGMSTAFVTKEAAEGRMPSLRMGYKFRFRQESIEKYVESLESPAVESSEYAKPQEIAEAS